jgi:ribosomal protein S18 acetylase RimI-like enzyme
MIRAAQPDDSEFVTRLAHEFNVFGMMYVGVFQGFFQRDRDSFLICTDDEGQRMGFAQVQWTTHVGDIQGVVADPAFRRRGVATELLNHIEQAARDRGVSTLKCITAETQNPAALNCFTRRGFVVGEVMRQTYPNGQRAVSLSRTLN